MPARSISTAPMAFPLDQRVYLSTPAGPVVRVGLPEGMEAHRTAPSRLPLAKVQAGEVLAGQMCLATAALAHPARLPRCCLYSVARAGPAAVSGMWALGRSLRAHQAGEEEARW